MLFLSKTTVKERLNREHAHGLESQSKIQSLEREQNQLRQEKEEVTLLLSHRTSDYEILSQNKSNLEGELKDAKLSLAVAQSQAGRTERQEEDLKRTMQVMGHHYPDLWSLTPVVPTLVLMSSFFLSTCNLLTFSIVFVSFCSLSSLHSNTLLISL